MNIISKTILINAAKTTNFNTKKTLALCAGILSKKELSKAQTILALNIKFGWHNINDLLNSIN